MCSQGTCTGPARGSEWTTYVCRWRGAVDWRGWTRAGHSAAVSDTATPHTGPCDPAHVQPATLHCSADRLHAPLTSNGLYYTLNAVFLDVCIWMFCAVQKLTIQWSIITENYCYWTSFNQLCKLESDVWYRVCATRTPSGESYKGNRRPGRK